MTANLLAGETSPYLLQHKDNPVAWMPWGEAALARARAEGRPIMLSVGYAACHWCHVMAHESFEDPATADRINQLFVPIKVDREERPDLDYVYQSALALMGQQGGWPLTMFLTPDGAPFWGGTYFPPVSRYGRPGFRDVLDTVAEAYRTRPDAVTGNVDALKAALTRAARPAAGTIPGPADFDAVAEAILQAADPDHGGTRGAPKFPQAPMLELLWRAHLRTGRDDFARAVTTGLRGLCQGGIYDHVGGGFARYAVDEAWRVPHFEKMLYDNAALLDLMTLVWQRTGSALLDRRVRETVGWALTQMRVETGAFASSFDADSEHEEGRYYVWTEAELDAVLGPDADAFKRAYGVTPGGNWEHGTSILNRLDAGDEPGDAFAEARARLDAVRVRRVPPARDDKVLADWNGQMIAALANAGFAFAEPEWVTAAARAFDAVAASHDAAGHDAGGHDIRRGRLHHSWCAGRKGAPGLLDDYAAMARAALALADATGEDRYVAAATQWVETVERHFADPAGGWFLTPDDGEALVVRPKHAHDNATPPGNAVMIAVLARLGARTGDGTLAERAERAARAVAGVIPTTPIASASLVNALETLVRPIQIVLPGGADTAALLDAVRRSSVPDRVVVRADHGTLPSGHAASGRRNAHQERGPAAAHVCAGPVCSAPLADATDLHGLLARIMTSRSAA